MMFITLYINIIKILNINYFIYIHYKFSYSVSIPYYYYYYYYYYYSSYYYSNYYYYYYYYINCFYFSIS